MLHQKHSTEKGWRRRIPVAVAVRKTLLDAYGSAAVAELEHAVRGTGTSSDHATPSPPFAGKCGDDGSTSRY
jgi:hypothetical protein